MAISVQVSVQSKVSLKARIDNIDKAFKGKSEANAGLISGKTPSDVLEYANYNEFGTVHIPERSFIRSTAREIKPKLVELGQRAIKGIVNGQPSLEPALNIIGQTTQRSIQAKIASNVPPALNPKTIARKGSSVTLIDSGRMRQSVTYEVK